MDEKTTCYLDTVGLGYPYKASQKYLLGNEWSFKYSDLDIKNNQVCRLLLYDLTYKKVELIFML